MAVERNARAVYVISVAAELAGVHPQTLRIYERKGLLEPRRTSGGSRRYSDADLGRLQRIAELTEAGVSLAGVRRILELEAEVAQLRAELEHAKRAVVDSERDADRRSRRDLVPLRQSVAVFGEVPSIFRQVQR